VLSNTVTDFPPDHLYVVSWSGSSAHVAHSLSLVRLQQRLTWKAIDRSGGSGIHLLPFDEGDLIGEQPRVGIERDSRGRRRGGDRERRPLPSHLEALDARRPAAAVDGELHADAVRIARLRLCQLDADRLRVCVVVPGTVE
jgi:hypothetical protein